jgi:hypothetical protein
MDNLAEYKGRDASAKGLKTHLLFKDQVIVAI